MKLPNPKDNQEVFSYIKKFINNQGQRSYNDFQCCYLTQNKDGASLKCAVGCLIPDNDYCSDFEGGIVSQDSGCYSSSEITDYCKNKGYDIKLLEACQDAHDRAWSGEKFILSFNNSMAMVAERFGLRNE